MTARRRPHCRSWTETAVTQAVAAAMRVCLAAAGLSLPSAPSASLCTATRGNPAQATKTAALPAPQARAMAAAAARQAPLALKQMQRPLADVAAVPPLEEYPRRVELRRTQPPQPPLFLVAPAGYSLTPLAKPASPCTSVGGRWHLLPLRAQAPLLTLRARAYCSRCGRRALRCWSSAAMAASLADWCILCALQAQCGTRSQPRPWQRPQHGLPPQRRWHLRARW